MAENKNWIDRVLGFLLGNAGKKFKEVILDQEVVGEIIQIARESHPLEFAALLEGEIKGNILKIDSLVFLPGETSNQGAVMKTFMMPLTTSTVGSVHSHPIPNASPSSADLQFFAENGFFHLIIAYPYTKDSIIAYDTFGEIVDYHIK
ncbi:MAG: hypothetical protein PWQ15_1443 [Methanobacterium sp.]|jgi:proteasome lid subunit RPN8/RPN11|uniref:Mov34/MPN/PAD-1 family protein n=1 Tax=Methanobacterium sp. TaxID=2164 RepID=UPI0003C95CB2|nr:Mov34/MPN/PAD-1 family protein [Methanobacterium sp.]MDI3550340.1 hypothetical protein [Methanobacterium sp.]CDG65678.1 Mov34/MPN/PAD-1 family protein [Methanobacterium sp. MB1]